MLLIFLFDKAYDTCHLWLTDLGMDDDGDDDPVPLPNVNAAILKKVADWTDTPTPQSRMVFLTRVCCVYACVLKVIQWCTHHKDDPPPPEDDENKEKRTDDIPVWDQEFLKVDQGTLFELILVNKGLFFLMWWGGSSEPQLFWNSLEFLAAPRLFIDTCVWLHVIPPRKQAPEQRPKYKRDEATDAGRAVNETRVRRSWCSSDRQLNVTDCRCFCRTESEWFISSCVCAAPSKVTCRLSVAAAVSGALPSLISFRRPITWTLKACWTSPVRRWPTWSKERPPRRSGRPSTSKMTSQRRRKPRSVHHLWPVGLSREPVQPHVFFFSFLSGTQREPVVRREVSGTPPTLTPAPPVPANWSHWRCS